MPLKLPSHQYLFLYFADPEVACKPSLVKLQQRMVIGLQKRKLQTNFRFLFLSGFQINGCLMAT